ncbi:MAG: SGNH/GDSL hydrolase family protein [Pseudonocardia sp.]|nr:SGNH/GDSL hydrolase family protein [Pseudonocardia sp.]MBO0876068.1 SGNH/GDSL hydrolase family protein [Pseudonocardia sp.]
MRVRALVAMLTATATCLITGSLIHPPAARAQECVRPRGPLVAYGHSYLLSPQIGGATASYATLVASSMRLKPVIRAVNGGTTPNVDKLVHTGSTRWVPGTSDLVVIDSGINDIEEKLPSAQWTGALRHVLSAFASRPVPEILLVRPLQVSARSHPGHDPKVIAAYAAEQRKVASEFSAVRIVDASDGWNPRLALSPDGIHPNTIGELHIARAVQRSALNAFCRP